MTLFIKRVVSGDEKLIAFARLHWIYLTTGFFMFLIFSLIGFFFDGLIWRHFGSLIPAHRQEIFGIPFGAQYPWIAFFFICAGAVIFFLHVLKKFTTEIGLTDERLIYKTGWIFVHVDEIDLTEIRAEQINHGLLGRFLGYGQLHLDSRFVGDIYLPAIRQPYPFLRKLHKVRNSLHDPLE